MLETRLAGVPGTVRRVARGTALAQRRESSGSGRHGHCMRAGVTVSSAGSCVLAAFVAVQRAG
ncbi:hypothetical protein P5W99_23190 [Paraburkholderia sp. A3BS-1L]|uniref:hypothetical protein n=1 Tax=unclassified Paraburkholderia TaxID=2615204 RepID=UPI003B7F2E58